MGGAIKPYQNAQLPAEFLPKEPVYKSLWMGRALAVLALFGSALLLGSALDAYVK